MKGCDEQNAPCSLYNILLPLLNVVHYGISTTVLSMLQDGQTALFNSGNADVVKILVDKGAVVDIRDKVDNCLVTCMRSMGVASF